MRPPAPLIASLTLALMAGGGLAAYSLAVADPVAQIAVGGFQMERLSLPDVTLIDQDARATPFKGPLTEGQILVITFGYTTCDTICPLGNVVMADLDMALAPDRRIRLMSITIDPATDTPELMRKAAETFGASTRWSWLTGTPVEIDRLLEAFDADYANIALHDPMFLVGRVEDGRFYRSLSMPDPADLVRIIDAMDV
ncbi:protein SCO1/2 [Roseovarius sp. MBR-51]